jgi:tetratricopeptide (TPR) repeat protein
MEGLTAIKGLMHQGKVKEAIEELDRYLLVCTVACKEEAYYLKGNAYRKQGNWQQALNCYQSAIELNPHSPALQARDAINDILDFHNKDMCNQ